MDRQRATSARLAKAIWDMPAGLTNRTVGGARMRDIVGTLCRVHGEHQRLLEYARIRRWIDGIGIARRIDGPQHDGYGIGRILLERAGGNLDAMIIDHVDQAAH